jgi:membrane glycosyltransferase
MDGITQRKLPDGAVAGFAALPPECPLAMPEQSLWEQRERATSPGTGSRWVWLRRLMVFTAALAMTAAGGYEMFEVLDVGGLSTLEGLILALFIILFAWIALSFVSTVIGMVATLRGPDRSLGIDARMPLPEIGSRTALLLPTYNEDPHRVMARLQAICESVRDTGRLERFDFYILSDTTDPATWIAEEALFRRLRGRIGDERLFYRHRTRNIARKAGNIAEWVTRFGGGYDHMVVLDADSLMDGDTIVRLVAAMEAHPRVGLIQTLPILLNGNTLFARVQQFAGRVYGPLIARGIAWWHGAEGNYWGHNAIIRVQAFAAQAGLPLLKGGKPFGGHILSHDFVEAALMRRAGWGIHMAPSLGGSYEECPPSVTDYAVRDRRWCQGNLQHAGILPARGLHWVSRLHLLTGIGSYITAPLWLLFLLVGIMISLQAYFIRPEYFSSGASLFPQWPAQDPVRAAYVFAGTMAMLVLPKLMGYLAMLPRSRDRRGIGGALRGFVSLLLEIIVSALIAPIMMLMQTRAVSEILLGRDSGWSAQRRDEGEVSPGEIGRRYLAPTLFGFVLAVAAYSVSLPLVLWMSPVLVGLVLAIPVVSFTSRSAVGRVLRRAGLLLTPEERSPPPVLVRANALIAEPNGLAGDDPFAALSHDPQLFDAHLGMIGEPERRAKGDVDLDLIVALAKIEQAENREEAIGLLGRKEIFAVLAHRDALRRLFVKPTADHAQIHSMHA